MNLKKYIYLVTEENFENIRLDRWLTLVHTKASRSFIIDLLEKNKIQVNGRFEKPSYKIRLGDRIDLEIPEIENVSLVPLDKPLDIVYQDEQIVVINKPAGLVVHPAAGHASDTLVNVLLHHIKNLSMKNENRPGIVHRIDKDTSGLLVIAKNDLAHENLSAQFKNKTVHRIYHAVADGTVKEKSGILKSYLVRSTTDRKKYSSFKIKNTILRENTGEIQNGKWAVTEFESLQYSQKKSLLRLKLQTGRTHQIRVHLSDIGHPLVGDYTYGYSIKKNKEQSLNRFYLHAAELGFLHPQTNQFMKWSIGWPKKDLDIINSWGFNV